jgi:hypothetical protein
MVLELSGPHVRPLGAGVRIAGGDLQMPCSIVANEEAGDMLEPERLHAGVVLESANLQTSVSKQLSWLGGSTYEDLEALAPDDQLDVLLAELHLDRIHRRTEERLECIHRGVV